MEVAPQREAVAWKPGGGYPALKGGYKQEGGHDDVGGRDGDVGATRGAAYKNVPLIINDYTATKIFTIFWLVKEYQVLVKQSCFFTHSN